MRASFNSKSLSTLRDEEVHVRLRFHLLADSTFSLSAGKTLTLPYLFQLSWF